MAMEETTSTFVDENGDVRLRDIEFVQPICFGTVAFWLGKKASEYCSHRWTVYVRGPNNEDLSHIIQKATFELHHTFNNPNRGVEKQPFEVTENGWGEFEIGITLHFTPDAKEKDVQVFHRLKLYEEDGQQPQNPKKPVVTETYDEIVFSEPVKAFYDRVISFKPGPAPESEITPYYPPHNQQEDLEALAVCRAKVAAMVQDLKKEFDAVR